MRASGAAGPFLPQLGRTIWIRLTGTWHGEIDLGTTTTGNCADAVPLSQLAGRQIIYFGPGAVTPPAAWNQPVGEETQAGVGWCLTATPGFTGSVSYRLAQ